MRGIIGLVTETSLLDPEEVHFVFVKYTLLIYFVCEKDKSKSIQ